MTDQLDYQRRVLLVFAHADIRDELLWHGTRNGIRFHANISDLFDWGTADAEPIDPEDVGALEQAYRDCLAVGAARCTAELYAARRRGMRPQGAAYPVVPAAQALFNACGPKRTLGLGNPRQPKRNTEEGTP